MVALDQAHAVQAIERTLSINIMLSKCYNLVNNGIPHLTFAI